MDNSPVTVPPRQLHLEIAVQSASDAQIALRNGADRIELCQALELGGLTPSLGTVDSVLAVVDPSAVNVLVRPRSGGFVYAEDEVEVVAADIRQFVSMGVGGVVVGALTSTGAIDRRAIRTWRDAARNATLTFHRAIDVVEAPVLAAREVADMGVDRILTSGGAARSVEGCGVVRDICSMVAGRAEVMAGGGVRPTDISLLIQAGVSAIHLSARTTVGHEFHPGPGGGPRGHSATDAGLVAAAAMAVQAA